jgi:hypothetical protein
MQLFDCTNIYAVIWLRKFFCDFFEEILIHVSVRCHSGNKRSLHWLRLMQIMPAAKGLGMQSTLWSLIYRQMPPTKSLFARTRLGHAKYFYQNRSMYGKLKLQMVFILDSLWWYPGIFNFVSATKLIKICFEMFGFFWSMTRRFADSLFCQTHLACLCLIPKMTFSYFSIFTASLIIQAHHMIAFEQSISHVDTITSAHSSFSICYNWHAYWNSSTT